MDARDISLGLLSQSPIQLSQKRAHSSDENEPKKNLKTGDTSVEIAEIYSSQESCQNDKIRVKIVKQIFRDSHNANGIVIKSTLIRVCDRVCEKLRVNT